MDDPRAKRPGPPTNRRPFFDFVTGLAGEAAYVIYSVFICAVSVLICEGTIIATARLCEKMSGEEFPDQLYKVLLFVTGIAVLGLSLFAAYMHYLQVRRVADHPYEPEPDPIDHDDNGVGATGSSRS